MKTLIESTCCKCATEIMVSINDIAKEYYCITCAWDKLGGR